ncbi:MAG TPA: carbohydrate-binding protein, partial [Opitutaceae bacterium]|nr:carbohydrate-binding protein [Opitutaceae bacterium]
MPQNPALASTAACSRLIRAALAALTLLVICAVPVALIVAPAAAYAQSTAPAWTAGTTYKVGDLVTYNGVTYVCLQAHTALTGWEPPNVPALWAVSSSQPPPTVPATPTGLSATANSTSQITVTWNSSSGATSYDLQVDGAIKTGVTSPYVQTGLAANSTHTYAVRADNSAGDSAFSALVSAMTLSSSTGKATGVPGTPVLSQSTWNGESSYTITMNMWWGNNGTTWQLYENGALVHTQTLVDNSPNAQTASVSFTGKPNGTYTYTTKLTNSFGTTAGNTLVYTVTQGGTTPTIPAVPTGLSATANSTSQITVTWNSSSGATSYDLQVDGVTKTNVTSPYVQTGLAANSTHTYAVRADNSVGDSAFSAQVSATTQAVPTVPATPTGLTATPNGTSQITVTWNNSNGATSYDLQVDGATVTNASNPYVHTGLAASSKHTYAVRADNSAGDSAFSATVSATTAA